VMEGTHWQPVISVLDARVAHSMADLLEAELIRVSVTPDSMTTEAVPSWTVFVPVEQLESARNLFARSQFTDSELTFLATGELGGPAKVDDTG
jgi:hypothetical protein